MKKFNTTMAIVALFLSTINAQDGLGSTVNAADSKKGVTTDATSGLSGESNAAALKIGFIDMNRLFTAYPATKQAEETINAEKAKAGSELDQRLERLKAMMAKIEKQSGAARENLVEQARALDKENSDFRTSREKILADRFKELRKQIIDELTVIVKEVSDANGLNVLYDTSGMSMGQVPVIFYTKGVFDITDACIEKAKSPVKAKPPVKDQKKNQGQNPFL
jgi:Skp family chaperone for outer membrane proteins